MAGGRHLARRSAVQALYQWQLTGQAPAEIVGAFIDNDKLTGAPRDYFLHLVTRIPAEVEKIDSLIKRHSARDLARVDLLETAILRLGVYELLFAGDVPTKVALDEAVGLAKTFCAEQGYAFVNAVLDKVAVEVRGDTDAPASTAPPATTPPASTAPSSSSASSSTTPSSTTPPST